MALGHPMGLISTLRFTRASDRVRPARAASKHVHAGGRSNAAPAPRLSAFILQGAQTPSLHPGLFDRTAVR